MKKIIILLITLLPVLGFAQKAKKDIQKTSFEVNGVCGMCKARIEKQAFRACCLMCLLRRGTLLPVDSASSR